MRVLPLVLVLATLVCVACGGARTDAPSRPERTPEQRIEMGLKAPSIQMAEAQLALVPAGTPGRERLEKHVHDLKAAEQARQAERARELQATRAKWLATKAGRIWQKHQDWPEAVCEAIAQGKVHIGMTMDQCRLAWGSPRDTTRTTTARGTITQWCYGDFCSSALYFKDETLVTIQD